MFSWRFFSNFFTVSSCHNGVKFGILNPASKKRTARKGCSVQNVCISASLIVILFWKHVPVMRAAILVLYWHDTMIRILPSWLLVIFICGSHVSWALSRYIIVFQRDSGAETYLLRKNVSCAVLRMVSCSGLSFSLRIIIIILFLCCFSGVSHSISSRRAW